MGCEASAVELSVVIACLNGAETLGAQLEALARQTYGGPVEVVIADNGSTDATLSVVEGFRDRLDLRVIDASDYPGQAHARNQGALAANGSSVLFLDQDDVVADEYLAAMAAALAEGPFVAGRLELERLNPPWAVEARSIPQTTQLFDLGFPMAYGCTLGIRREAFLELDGFDARMTGSGEDSDLCYRAADAGVELRFVGDAVVHYRLRHTLRAIFRQGRSYGRGRGCRMAKSRTEGLPLATGPSEWRRWAATLRILLSARSRSDLAHGTLLLGERIGLVVWRCQQLAAGQSGLRLVPLDRLSRG